jgi:rubrerythrin
MIWLDARVLKGITAPKSGQDLWPALQQAIELEHATIPVYLYALYSLDCSKNAKIAGIIQSVVIEEMLHMTLASNVLNALGGAPSIDDPDFIPTYPGPLPGGVESDLIVNLAPFSMAQLQTCLRIEEPQDPLNIRGEAELEAVDQITIGEFYTVISKAIAALGDGAFVDPPRNQVGPDLMRDSVLVTNVASAQAAIERIMVQGEGTTTSPFEGGSREPAHYYRFMQIQKGHLLVPLPPPQNFAYVGDPVPFDETGVYAVPTNPKAASYPAGGAQRFACDNFNYTYTSLLIALHALFNGANTTAQVNTVIGLMMSLKSQAKAMMSGIPNPAVLTGPSFEYERVNP